MQEKITFDIFIRKAAIVLLVVLVLLTMNYLSGVLLPFFVAWLFAYLLYPIVRFVQYRMKVKIRALAILVTLVFVIGLISLMLWFIIPPMIEQFQKLGDVMSRWVQQTTHTNNVSALIRDFLSDHRTEIERFFKSKDFSDAMRTAMPRLFEFVGQTANVVLSIIASMITLLYMFFILLDYEFLTTN